MAIPALVGYAHIIMALITKLRLIPMTIHAGTIQTHDIPLLVARYIDRPGVPNDQITPVL
jgi:hypothetical protein